MCVQVTGGSGDRNVYIWEAATGQLRYRLPGHTGSVNQVVFHPKEPVVASASSDKTLYLGELAY
jgi:Prp8 binding protein